METAIETTEAILDAAETVADTTADDGTVFVVLLALFLLITICGGMAYILKKKGGSWIKSAKQIEPRPRREKAPVEKVFNPIRGAFKHAIGLPIAPGVVCDLILSDTGIAITGSGVNFNLPIDRVLSVEKKTDTEVQNMKQYVSSAGGAFMGNALLGPVGALIGGRAKKKNTTITSTENYLVITYRKEGNIDFVLFDVCDAIFKATRFVAGFESLHVENTQSIEL